MRQPTAEPRTLAAVALGGALGALLRYAAVLAAPVPAAPGAIPWTIVGVNVVGCLAMGALLGWVHERAGVPALARPFLGTGMCGGFTTFSTFALDTTRVGGADPGAAAAYVALTLLGSIAAVWVGFALTRRLLPLPSGIPDLAHEAPPRPEEGEA